MNYDSKATHEKFVREIMEDLISSGFTPRQAAVLERLVDEKLMFHYWNSHQPKVMQSGF